MEFSSQLEEIKKGTRPLLVKEILSENERLIERLMDFQISRDHSGEISIAERETADELQNNLKVLYDWGAETVSLEGFDLEHSNNVKELQCQGFFQGVLTENAVVVNSNKIGPCFK